ncbi:PHO85 cyclin-5 [Basidiobolus ranarum]|uniref:PHO85 cyclin-5 n=1 Tax=Basidiobolus ranarum TaxID=34480 RepID=A0ABR2W289_9FUNG
MHYTGGGLESLVEAVEYVIERIWHPLSSISRAKRLVFRGFIRETLKTSRVYHSTVILSLYYLYKLRGTIRGSMLGQQYDPHGGYCLEELALTSPLFDDGDNYGFDSYSASMSSNHDDHLYFARNTFIGALIAASKYHQEKSPLNMDWARYTNLELSQVNDLELEFLGCIKYHLHVSTEEYEFWNVELLNEVHQVLSEDHHRRSHHEHHDYVSISGKNKMTGKSPHYSGKIRSVRIQIHGLKMDSWKSSKYDSVYEQKVEIGDQDFMVTVRRAESRRGVWPL